MHTRSDFYKIERGRTVEYTIGYIAEKIGGRVIGNADRLISSMSPVENIRSDSLVFLKSRRALDLIDGDMERLCVVVDFEPDTKGGRDYIVIDPKKKDEAFIRLLTLFDRFFPPLRTISERASISPDARIGEDVRIEEFVYVGENTTIMDGTRIGSNSVIGSDCTIGKNCTLYPRVTLYPGSILEDDVIVQSGAVIGSDGFGYSNIDGLNRKIPHIGGVYIEKNVEIGANTTIDRGTIDHTRIGENTKIDNLVQIAHNVVIGKNSVICAQCGISGSVKIGNNVILAGAVGLKDHIEIEDNVYVGAMSGVMERVVKKGSRLLGRPAKDFKQEMEFFAMKPKLKEMYADVKKIKEKLGL